MQSQFAKQSDGRDAAPPASFTGQLVDADGLLFCLPSRDKDGAARHPYLHQVHHRF
jgi:hypothetical protein